MQRPPTAHLLSSNITFSESTVSEEIVPEDDSSDLTHGKISPYGVLPHLQTPLEENMEIYIDEDEDEHCLPHKLLIGIAYCAFVQYSCDSLSFNITVSFI